MNKNYSGKLMIKKSRFIKYLEKMSSEELNEIIDKINFYICDNKEYCDKGNYQHLCNIFTSMLLYEILVKHGKKEKEAEDIVFNTMYEYMNRQKEIFQRLSKKGWFWSIIKKIVPLGFKLGSGNVWKYTFFKKGGPKNIFRFECNSCIYQQIFKNMALIDSAQNSASMTLLFMVSYIELILLELTQYVVEEKDVTSNL